MSVFPPSFPTAMGRSVIGMPVSTCGDASVFPGDLGGPCLPVKPCEDRSLDPLSHLLKKKAFRGFKYRCIHQVGLEDLGRLGFFWRWIFFVWKISIRYFLGGDPEPWLFFNQAAISCFHVTVEIPIVRSRDGTRNRVPYHSQTKTTDQNNMTW